MNASLFILALTVSFMLGRAHANWSRKRMIDRIMDEQDEPMWSDF